ncbi:small GTP-binding protein, putative [Trichomonas vaginalis G3]|uniref:Small GTP-binding protein, putative n=2 Tax=Trichomonas vaginalis TaxID=5722 RepID=A0A8U0WP73_TRIV3|nr:small Rab GTPase RabB4 [Trichomonas vaginalis G3]AAX97466.1 small Rab GTPase RabB4 [Trichomonas vaginalis]EAY02431.1 small GTP-binding protein, putative [Trichomonas vaginalis G3]KAI5527875.1 small Rab GTPase RabB4 [Trichomonas vaginalis G3]|eukprot:XP_001314689.1 small GTP-binding protein [Trichomonas vaginalis G3]
MTEARTPDARVIILGNTQVGKTALLSRFIDKTYTPTTTSTVTPVLSPTVVQTNNGESVHMQFWDTAGQERYQSIGQVFYRSANFAIMCYDCSDENPLPALQKWKQNILNVEPDCQLYLAGTKYDLIDPSKQLEIIESGERLKGTLGCLGFFATSAVTGDGVDILFSSIADNWYNQIKSKSAKTPQNAMNQKTKDNNGGCCK